MDYGDEIYYDERFTKDIGTSELLVMSATEAKKLTDEVICKQSSSELNKVMGQISEAIDTGNYFIMEEGVLLKSTISALESLGYKVKHGMSACNEQYYEISWRDGGDDLK